MSTASDRAADVIHDPMAAALADALRGYRYVMSDRAMLDGCALSFERDQADPRMVIVMARVPCPPECDLPPDMEGEIVHATIGNAIAGIARLTVIAESSGNFIPLEKLQ